MKLIYVKDVYTPDSMLSAVVHADEPLEEVIRRFAQEAWLRGIFVTNGSGQLLGVINRMDLLDWAQLRLGTVLRDTTGKPERVLRLIQLLMAAKASQAVHPGSQQASVRLDDQVDRALALMLQVDLIAIPVVDNTGYILGDLTLSQVLRYLLVAEKDG
jgi:CBS domain-containing protein